MLHSSLEKVLSEKDIRARFESQGCDVVAGSREALAQMVRKDQDKWRDLIRERHITLQ